MFSDISSSSLGSEDLPILPRKEDPTDAVKVLHESSSSRRCHLIRESNLPEEDLELAPEPSTRRKIPTHLKGTI